MGKIEMNKSTLMKEREMDTKQNKTKLLKLYQKILETAPNNAEILAVVIDLAEKINVRSEDLDTLKKRFLKQMPHFVEKLEMHKNGRTLLENIEKNARLPKKLSAGRHCSVDSLYKSISGILIDANPSCHILIAKDLFIEGKFEAVDILIKLAEKFDNRSNSIDYWFEDYEDVPDFQAYLCEYFRKLYPEDENWRRRYTQTLICQNKLDTAQSLLNDKSFEDVQTQNGFLMEIAERYSENGQFEKAKMIWKTLKRDGYHLEAEELALIILNWEKNNRPTTTTELYGSQKVEEMREFFNNFKIMIKK